MLPRSTPPRSFQFRELEARYVDIPGAVLTEAGFDFDRSTFTGAVYRADGGLVLESLRPSSIGHWRHVDPITIDRNVAAQYPSLGSAIYGGHFFTMWGHFLLETLSTALCAPDMPDLPVVFTPFAHRCEADWEARRGIMAAAGWGSRPLALQQGPARFDHLFVPERLVVIAPPDDPRKAVHPSLPLVYERIRREIAPGRWPRHVVVAKRPTWFTRKHPAESDIYNIFEKAGFSMMDGALMTPEDQVDVLSEAKALIGFTGSNLHNCVFCHKNVPVIELADERSYRMNQRNNYNQIGICSALAQPLLFADTFDQSTDLSPISAETIAANVLHLLGEYRVG